MYGTRITKRLLSGLLCVAMIATMFSGLMPAPVSASYEGEEAGRETDSVSAPKPLAAGGEAEVIAERRIDPKYFMFTVMTANGASTVGEYRSFSELKGNDKGLTVTDNAWNGAEPGSTNASVDNNVLNTYPQIEGYVIDSVRVNDTKAYRLGLVSIAASDEGESERNHVYFSSVAAETSMSYAVIPEPKSGESAPINVVYVPEEYSITYEVFLDGVKQLADDPKFGVNAIFGARHAEITANKNFAVDVNIPYGYTGDVYIGDKTEFQDEVAIPNNALLKHHPTDIEGYNYPLGEEPVYQVNDNTITIDSANGPSMFTLSGSYNSGEELINADQICRVVLTSRNSFKFDPSLWLGTDYAGGTGHSRLTIGNGYASGRQPFNIENSDYHFSYDKVSKTYSLVWQFSTTTTGNGNWEMDSFGINGVALKIPFAATPSLQQTQTRATTTTQMPFGATVTITEERTYEFLGNNSNVRQYTFTFTNYARDIVITSGNLHGASSAELIPDQLHGVNAEYLANPISNGRYDSMAQGKPIGVGTNNGYITYGATNNIRFTLQNGFEWSSGDTPKAGTFTGTSERGDGDIYYYDSNGRDLSGNVGGISRSGDGEQYTLTLSEGSNTENIHFFSIIAQPKDYVVVYRDGIGNENLNPGVNLTVKEGTMPTFPKDYESNYSANENVDDNHGSKYSVAVDVSSAAGTEASRVVTVHNSIPEDSSARPASFKGWVVTNKDGQPLNERGGVAANSNEYIVLQNSDGVDLETINVIDERYSDSGDNRDYAIYLTAWWQAAPEPFYYYVTLNYKDENGEEHTRWTTDDDGLFPNDGTFGPSGEPLPESDPNEDKFEEGDSFVAKRETYFRETDDGLTVAFDTTSPDMASLLEGLGLWYKYDNSGARNGSKGNEGHFVWEGVKSNSEIPIWLVSNLGVLTVSKNVENGFGGDDNDEFELEIQFTLPEDDTGTSGKENEYFGTGESYSVNYTGKDGTKSLELSNSGGNTYTGVLKLKESQEAYFLLPDGTQYTITERPIDGYKQTKSENLEGQITATTTAKATVTNEPAGIVISKAIDEGDEKVTEATVGSWQEVTYSITVQNREQTSKNIVITDVVPADLTITNNGDADSAVGNTLTWTKRDVAPNGKATVTFKVRTGLVEELKTYENVATAVFEDEAVDSETYESNDTTLTVNSDWLKVSKTVGEAKTGGESEKFNFSISLTGGDIGSSYDTLTGSEKTEGELTLDGGNGAFELAGGEVIYILGLPENAHYVVTEATAAGYDTVPANENGNINYTSANEVEFTNTYYLGGLDISKTVSGEFADRNKEFDFTVKLTPNGHTEYFGRSLSYTLGVESKEMQLTPADGNTYTGTITLKDKQTVHFDLPAGTHYEITEAKAAGYTADEATQNGDVTVNSTSTASFTNTYSLKEKVVDLPNVKKVLDGDNKGERKLKEGEFEFNVTVSGEPSDGCELSVKSPVRNEANGNVPVGSITFTKPGTYTVSISEVRGSDSHITYDETPHEITYTVTDTGNGTLDVATTGDDGDITFKNTYTPTPTTATIQITKALTGAGATWDETLDNGKYTFTLAPNGGEMPMPTSATAKNSGQNVEFEPITYMKAGTYEYTIEETDNANEDNHVTRSTETVYVRVTVTDNDGTLSAKVEYSTDNNIFSEAAPTVTNTYKPDELNMTLTGTKEIEGREWSSSDNGKYTFQIEGTGETKYGPKTVKNNEQEIEFTVPISEIGDYDYIITEAASGDAHVAVDSTKWYAHAKVTRGEDGALRAEIKYGTSEGDLNANTFTFTNTYTPSAGTAIIRALKQVEDIKGNDVWKNELDDNRYTFKLESDDGAPLPEPATATNNGQNVTFGAITYKTAGTYKYTIKESGNGNSSKGVVTSEEIIYVTVVATDVDGEIETDVTYSYSESGDEASAVPLAITNTYKPTPVTVTLTGNKEISGRKWQSEVDNGAYTFEFKKMSSEEAAKTVTNDESAIKFDVSMDAVESVTYSITETHSAALNVNKSDDVKYACITTTRSADGTLAYTVGYSDSAAGDFGGRDFTFRNVYVYRVLSIKKQIDYVIGNEPATREFVIRVSFEFPKGSKDFLTTHQSFGYTIGEQRHDFGDGSITLKSGETAVFDPMPAGTKYTVTEDEAKGYELASAKVGEETYEAGRELSQNETLVLTNTPTGFEVVKTQARIANAALGGAGKPESFKEDEIEVGARGAIEYRITVTNRSKYDKTVSLSDAIPLLNDEGGANEDHRQMWMIPGTITQPPGVQQGVIEGTYPDNVSGEQVGGTVKWDNFTIPAHESMTFSFRVRVPILLHEHAFENTAILTEDGEEVARSNTVTANGIEDWLRIGKVINVAGKNSQVFYNDSGEKFIFHLKLSVPEGDNPYAEYGDPMIQESYRYISRISEAPGYNTEDTEGNNYQNLDITISDGGKTGTAEIELEAGHAVTILGLDPGLHYEVTEEPAKGFATRQDFYYPSVDTHIHQPNPDNEYEYVISPEYDDWMFFTNTYSMGKLEVSKRVQGNHADSDKEFTFTATFTPPTGDAYGADFFSGLELSYTKTGSAEAHTMTLTQDGGKYTGTFTLKDGESAAFDLPFGTGYSITEESAPGYTAAESTKAGTVEINIAEPDVLNGEAAIDISEAKPTEIEFVNTYAISEKTVNLPDIRKTLTGRTMNVGEFEFDIAVDAESGYRLENTSVANATSAGAETIDAGTITFTETGVYTVTVTEQNTGAANVAYDNRSYKAVYTVTDSGDGTFDVSASGDTGTLDFENSYIPNELTVSLDAVKTLSNRALKDGEFSFELSADAQDGMTVNGDGGKAVTRNGADGSVEFEDAITFAKAGAYTVKVKELAGSDAHITYDDETYTVTYTVTDDGVGNLTAAPDISGEDMSFENVFTPDAVSGSLTVTKTLSGRALEAEEFEFSAEVTAGDATGIVIEKEQARNDADGLVSFGEVEFLEPGEYTVTVKEINDAKPNIEYDTHEYRVNYHVTAATEGDGHLTVTSDTEGASEFANAYTVRRLTVGADVTRPKFYDGEKFSISVTLTMPESNPEYTNDQLEAAGFTGSGGVLHAVIEVDMGESVDLGLLPLGTVYTASETLDGGLEKLYELESVELNGAPQSGIDGETLSGDTEVEFINDPIGLEIVKEQSEINAEGLPRHYDVDELDVGGRQKISYRITVTNRSDEPVTVDSITDDIPGANEDHDGEEHRRMWVDEASILPEGGAFSGGEYDETSGQIMGGTVTWSDVEIPAEESVALSFETTVPIVLHSHTYTNIATAEFKGTEFVSNPVTVAAHEDWLRIGNEVHDAEDALTADPNGPSFSYTLTLRASEDGSSVPPTEYRYVGRVAEGYEDMDVLPPDDGTLTSVFNGFENGAVVRRYKFTLKAGQAITIIGLAAGVRYEVVQDYDPQGYESSWNYHPHANKTGAITDDGDDWIVFKNVYTADPVSASAPTAQKVLTGKLLRQNDYQFEISCEGDGVTLSEPTVVGNRPSGAVNTFGRITFARTGEFDVVIKEIIPEDADSHVKYDEHEFITHYVIADDSRGALYVASITPEGSNRFENVYTSDPVTARFTGTKNISGRDWSDELDDGKYTFEIKSETDGAPMPASATVTNDGHTVDFGEISFTSAGTYSYVISETGSEAANVPVSEETANITVNVTDTNRDGVFEIAVTGGDFEFTNVYTPTPEVRTLDVTKQLDGRALAEGEFEFALETASNDGIALTRTEAANAADGTVDFGDITFTKAGTYTVTVSETEPAEHDFRLSYDKSEYAITYTVSDDGRGNLSVDVSGMPEGGIVFRNTYTPVELAVEVPVITKTLNGRELIDGEFGFSAVLDGGEGAVLEKSSAVNDADGNISFGSVTFSDVGVYVLTVTENAGEDSHMDYDGGEVTVTFDVTLGDDGALKAATSVGDKKGFVNTYTPEPVSVSFEGRKEIEGRDWMPEYDESGAYSFTVSAVTDGAPMPEAATVQNSGHSITFGEIEFTEVGEYSYTITENEVDKSLAPFVTEDDKTVDVTVAVTDDGGKLSAEVSYANGREGEGFTFVNTFTDPKLSITKRTDRLTCDPHDQIHYTITVRNNSSETVEDIVVTDKAPEGLTADPNVLAAFPEYNPYLDESTQTVTWHIDSLAPNRSVQLIMFVFTPEIYEDTEYTNVATVEYRGGVAPVSSNAVTTTVPYIRGTLEVQKTVSYKPDNPAEDEFTLNFRFETQEMASNFFVKNNYEYAVAYFRNGEKGEMSIERVEDNVYTGSLKIRGGDTVSIDLPNRARYSVTEEESEDYLCVPNTPTTGTISTRTVSQVQLENIYKPEPPELSIVKTQSLNGDETSTETRLVKANDEITYNITVSNATGRRGPAQNVVIEDSVPSGLMVLGNTISDGGTMEDRTVRWNIDRITEEPVTVSFKVQVAPNVEENASWTNIAYASAANAADRVESAPVSLENRSTIITVAAPTLSKVLTGRELIDGEFTFTASALPADGVRMSKTAHNDADGNIDFGNITFTKPGEYVITVREEAGTDKNIDYDNGSIELRYSVTQDDATGVLSVGEPSFGEKQSFENSFTSREIRLAFSGKKAISGRNWDDGIDDGAYAFTLRPVTENAPMCESAVTHNTQGDIVFGDIAFTAAGTYEYEIVENDVDTERTPFVTKDDKTVHATVTVTQTDGVLEAKVLYDGEESFTFTNVYNVPLISITKRADRSTCDPQDQIHYTITVRNTSKVTLEDVVVTDVAPEGLTADPNVLAAFPEKNPHLDAETNTVTWNLGSLEPNKSVELIMFVFTPEVYVDTVYTNTASVTYKGAPAPVYSNSVSTSVAYTRGTLEVEKTVTNKPEDTNADEFKLDFRFELASKTSNFFVKSYDEDAVAFFRNGVEEKMIVQRVDDGVYTGSAMIRHGEKLVLHLPNGTRYTITEADHEDYLCMTEMPVTGTVTGHAASTEQITNLYNPAVLNVVKTQAVNEGEATSETATAKASDTVTYTVTVSNGKGADVPARNVTITDPVPNGLVVDPESITGGGELADGVISWNIENLADEPVTVSFRAALPDNPLLGASWSNVAYASADNAKAAQSAQTVLRFEAERAVDVSLHGVKSIAGRDWDDEADDAAYSFTIRALSAGAPLPEETTVSNSGHNITFGDIHFTAAGIYEYEITENPPDAQRSPHVSADTRAVRAVVQVTEYGMQLRASVSYGAGQSGDSFRFENTYLNPQLSLTKTVDRAVVPAGGILHYTITAKNDGEQDIAGVTVTDVLNELMYIDSETMDGHTEYGFRFDEASHTASWSIDKLAAGESVDLHLYAFAPPNSGRMTLENSARAESADIEHPVISNTVSTVIGGGSLEVSYSLLNLPVGGRPAPVYFNVTFTLPEGAEGYFGEGSNLSVKYTQNGSSLELPLAEAPDGSYTSSALVLSNGQTAVFELPIGTLYSVRPSQVPSGYRVSPNDESGTITGFSEAEFIGRYSAQGASITLPGIVKRLEGASLRDGMFEFEVYLISGEAESAYLPSNARNSGNGSVNFGQLRFSAVGRYVVGVREVIPEDAGDYEYDSHVQNVTYDVYDNGAGGLYAVASDFDGVIVFENIFTPSGANLVVTGSVRGSGADSTKQFGYTVTLDDESISGVYSGMTFENGVAHFTLSSGEYVSASGLPVGTGYTVTADAEDGYRSGTLSGNAGGTLRLGETVVEFVQEKIESTTPPEPERFGSLRVSKTVTGAGATESDLGAKYSFTLSVGADINGYYGEASFSHGTAEFDLSNGESIVISGLPEGTRYAVTERGENENGFETLYTNRTGTVKAEETVAIDVINEKNETPTTGGLVVSENAAQGVDKRFDYTVTLDDESISGEYGDMTFENGVAHFTLGSGESARAQGLPAGVGYKVEQSADSEFETVTPENAQGAISPNSTERVEFTNYPQGEEPPAPADGALKISKTVTGSGATAQARATKYIIELTVYGELEDGDYGEVTISGGRAVFSLSDGESATVSELPAGAKYELRELSEGEFTAKYFGEAGSIVSGETIDAAIVNIINGGEVRPETGGLTVNAYGGGGAQMSYTVTLDDESINGEYGDMTFENGVAHFTLSSGGRASAQGLPDGVGYSVEQDKLEGYDRLAVNSRGTITGGENIDVSFYNTASGDTPEIPSGSLRVSKLVTGAAGETDRDFTFEVALSDSEISGAYGDMSFENGVARFPLSSGESMLAENLPVGVKYTVTEFEAGEDGYDTASAGTEGVITDADTAEAVFINHRDVVPEPPKTGEIEISKRVEGENVQAEDRETGFVFVLETEQELTGVYGDLVFLDGRAVFTLRDGESVRASGLPDGMGYMLSEVEARGFHSVIRGAAGRVTADAAAHAEAINTKLAISETGSLTVLSVADDTVAPDYQFGYTVTLDDTGISGVYGDVEFSNGVAHFSLSPGESVTIDGLPAGVGYAVSEAEAEGYTCSVVNGEGVVEAGTETTVTFYNTMGEEPPAVPYGTLTVEKTVTGSDAEPERSFAFTVSVSDRSLNGVYGGFEFENGTAAFELSDGESVSAELPAGLAYTVVEDEAAKDDGYMVIVSGASGTVTEDAERVVRFENHRDAGVTPPEPENTGAIAVSKTVTGAGSTSQKFAFTLTLDDSEVNGRYGELEFTGGVAQFELAHGENVLAEGLPAGVGYTVSEQSVSGYTTTSNNATGVVPDGGTAYVSFFNNMDSGSSGGGGGGGGSIGGGTKPSEDEKTSGVLNTEDHFAYIVGYSDGTVRPLSDITRAEVVTIFFRMLTDEARSEHWSSENPFSDVSEGDWYNNAISTLSGMGIIDGYTDGTFRPTAKITRAELVKIAVGFFNYTGEQYESGFNDISDSWAKDYIETASSLGLINGYSDGSFRPDNNITRAETIAIVNRALNRAPHIDGMYEGMVVWVDNMNTDAWYYADIQEATNSHEYLRDLEIEGDGKSYEHWSEELPVRDWTALEKAWSDANSGKSRDDGEK